MIPIEIEAKMLPGKIRAELLSLSSENAEVVARQMVMIDRLLATGEEGDRALAAEFGRAASDRAGRVGVVRHFAGRAAIAVNDFSEAKRHFSAALRINGSPLMKVFLAESEVGLGKPRKALDLLGEIKIGALSAKESIRAHLVSAEAREALGQFDAALVTLGRKHEALLTELEKEEPDLVHRWQALKIRLTAVTKMNDRLPDEPRG